jgi:putrescine transport system ATP-binding protein
MAVMDAGRFKQIGTPTEIYEFPESRFVADFIGSANIFEGRVSEDGSDHVRVSTNVGEVYINHGQSVAENKQIWVGLRPEKIHLSITPPKNTGPNQIMGQVEDIGYLGETSIYKVRLQNGQIVDVTATNQRRPMNRTHSITWEDTVFLSWEPESVMLLTS